ncbi:hypothetical protein [Moorena bouillonii]|uniref:hypothetical protein n=1 Tax=Moorena bouillonii TaxID=207920 RepID=UPI001E57B189|nr:hypothetical protein [Moorena bouillonii]
MEPSVANKKKPSCKDGARLPKFLGKAIASRVRGAVAGEKFDEFHRNSARIIRQAVFGTDQ